MIEGLKLLKEDLSYLDNEEKLDYIIEYGDKLEKYPKDKIKNKYLVEGCVSEVHIFLELSNKNKKLKFYGKTSSIFIKGYLTILINNLSNLSVEKYKSISKSEIESFLKKTDIQKSLTPTRANSFGNILKKMDDLVDNLV